MQRTGRKKHAMFRVVVQDSRQAPTSGRVVAQLGSYDPHAKTNTLVKDKAEFYLTHGAQPSLRVVRLLASEGIKLPEWVKKPSDKQQVTRHPEKLRKNQPKLTAADDEAKTLDKPSEPSEPSESSPSAEPTAS